MPTIAQLLQAEGLEISDELAAKLPTLTEASDEVRGLVQTKNDLHDWKESNKDKVSGFEEINTKYEAELNEREKLAIENKDFEEQIRIRDERAAKQQETIDLRNKQTLQATNDSELASVASMFNSEYNGKLLAKNFVQTSLTETGEVQKAYNLNGQSFDSLDGLKAEMLKVPDLASQMKGVDSGGAGGQGSSGNGGEQFSKGKIDGTRSEKTAAAVSANPALKDLPIR